MTGRERMLATIRHEVPDRIPVDVINIENQPEIVAFWGLKNPQIRRDVHPTMDHYPEVYEKLGIDGRRVWAFYKGPTGFSPQDEPLSQWGDVITCDYGSTHWYPLARADTIAQIERHPWPKMEDYDFDQAARTAREWGRRYAVRGPDWWPLLCQLFNLMGMEETLVKLTFSPDVFEAALEQVFSHVSAYTQRLLEACGDDMPILCLGDDFATQRGLLISPAHWRRYLKPRYAQLFEIGKRAGKIVWFHSCGNITEVLPDLIDMGMDVWETVQLQTLPLSPREIKQQYGQHITFSAV